MTFIQLLFSVLCFENLNKRMQVLILLITLSEKCTFIFWYATIITQTNSFFLDVFYLGNYCKLLQTFRSCFILSKTKKLWYRGVTRGGRWGGRYPWPFFKVEKKTLILEKMPWLYSSVGYVSNLNVSKVSRKIFFSWWAFFPFVAV